jgi:transcriptional regulator with XRE-family HTH domain
MIRSASGKTHGKDYEDFGKKIAQAREAKGLSQKDASIRLGMPQSTYAGYETGARKIPLSLIKEFSRFYEISADRLLCGDPADKLPVSACFIDGDEFTDEEKTEILRYAKYIKTIRKSADSGQT